MDLAARAAAPYVTRILAILSEGLELQLLPRLPLTASHPDVEEGIPLLLPRRRSHSKPPTAAAAGCAPSAATGPPGTGCHGTPPAHRPPGPPAPHRTAAAAGRGLADLRSGQPRPAARGNKLPPSSRVSLRGRPRCSPAPALPYLAVPAAAAAEGAPAPREAEGGRKAPDCPAPAREGGGGASSSRRPAERGSPRGSGGGSGGGGPCAGARSPPRRRVGRGGSRAVPGALCARGRCGTARSWSGEGGPHQTDPAGAARAGEVKEKGKLYNPEKGESSPPKI